MRIKIHLEIFALGLLLLVGIAAALLVSRFSSQTSLYGTDPTGQQPVHGRLSATAAEKMLTEAEALLREKPANSEELTNSDKRPANSGSGSLSEPVAFKDSVWLNLVQSDSDAPGIFLQRLATSPAYLRQQKDDAEFSSDFWNIILAARLEMPAPGLPATAVVTQPPSFAAGQNRIVWLAQALEQAGFAVPSEWLVSGLVRIDDQAGLAAPVAAVPGAAAPDSALVSLELDALPPGSETVIFGRRQLTGSVQKAAAAKTSKEATAALASGSPVANESLKYRAFLQVENKVAAATYIEAFTNETAAINLQLDVRTWNPGLYETEILALANDGRGRYVGLGRLEVPQIEKMAYGMVKELSLATAQLVDSVAESGTEARFIEVYPRQTEQGWLYELTAANPGVPITTELFNLAGERIAYSDNPDKRWEGLRALAALEPDVPEQDLVAYARIGEKDMSGKAAAISADTAPGQQKPVDFSGLPAWASRFTLIQAGRAATRAGNPDEVYAVLTSSAVEATELRVQDKTGNQQSLPASELDIVEFSARLAQLAIKTGQGSIDYFPEFDPETNAFGLYLPADSGQLTLQLQAREGSFARVKAQVKSGNVTIADVAETAGLSLTLPELTAESVFEIGLSNGLGENNSYQVHILPSVAEDGYHRLLEAFPLSYRSPLYLLHIQQPNYNFVADQTNIDFAEFAAAQDFRDRSLVEADAVPASWVKPDSPVYDGRSWKAAMPEVISHFADPRNFINERDIFQFELLRFQPQAHTKEGIGAVLVNSFMAPDSELNPDNLEYDRLLLEAGETADISPLFLASRIVQEMGRNGESPLAFGNLPGYEGVYNFYNIGSTPNPSVPNGAQINGASYALYGREPDQQLITPEEEKYLLPWLSPAKAITGGAIWISERYVGIGQDTLYLQKFDLVSPELYTHQYAQNIQMAWAEGRRTQSSYHDAGLLDQAFTFRIPVFQGMPARPAALPDTPTKIIR